MSTAMYRRYRPETFNEVIGQEHVTEPLMAALAAGRVTHAYLFSGPRGCGKTSSARIFARCLNCAQGPTATPCGTCDSCTELGRGGSGSLDVVEIDAASHNGVDDARDLRERAAFAPVRDRYKIFILDEAHMVTTQGFNALLKLVEEPPDHVKFIFATTEPEKVIGTIRSRTHHYPFRLVPPGILTEYLSSLSDREGVEVGAGVLPMVVRAGGGSVRDSLSVLDQLMAGSGGDSLDYERAAALLGYTSVTLLDDAVAALAANDGGALFQVVDRMVQSGHDSRRFTEDFLHRMRDLVIIAVAGDAAGPALGPVPADQLAQMQEQARMLGAVAASRAADLTNTALSEMTGATSPRLQLELLCARLLINPATARPAAPAGRVTPPSPTQRPVTSPAREVARATPPPEVRAATTPTEPPATEQITPADPPPPAPPSAPPGAPKGTPSPVSPSTATPQPQDPAAGGFGALTAAARRATEALRGGGARVPVDPPPVVQERRREDPETRPAPAAVTPPEPESRAPSRGGDSTPGAVDTAMVRRRWSEVLETLAQIRRLSWAFVDQEATPGEVRDGVMKLTFRTEGLRAAFTNGPHNENLAAALRETLGVTVRIAAETGTAGTSSSIADAPREPTPDFEPTPEPEPEPSRDDDDGVSEDDETIEVSAEFGVPVIERILGGTVVEGARE